MKQKEVLFVGVQDPVSTRKNTLLAIKGLLEALKQYESYKALKEKKRGMVLELARVFDSLLVLNKKLRNRLPKASLPETSITREKEEKEESITGPAPVLARPRSQLDVLQEELEKIDERLSALEQ